MSDRLRTGRRGSIALCALLLAAGCTLGSTAGLQQSGPSASAVGDLGSTALTATPSTTTARATSTSAQGSGRRSPSLADAARRPAPDAKRVFTVSTVPTFFCDTTDTGVPAVAAYDDGTVLIADNLGANCERVPTISVGMIDRAELDRLATEYFDSPDATVSMSTALVTDLPNTTVLFSPIDRGAQSVQVYGLHSEDSSESTLMPTEERQARKTLARLIEAVSAPAERGTRWIPDRLVVVGGIQAGATHPEPGTTDSVSPWPIPLSPAVRSVIEAGGNERTCVTIANAEQVAGVLEAHGDRSAGAWWKVDGRDRLMLIGLVLPGYSAC